MRNWASVLDEMTRCDVVCANCHRRRATCRGDCTRGGSSMVEPRPSKPMMRVRSPSAALSSAARRGAPPSAPRLPGRDPAAAMARSSCRVPRRGSAPIRRTLGRAAWRAARPARRTPPLRPAIAAGRWRRHVARARRGTSAAMRWRSARPRSPQRTRHRQTRLAQTRVSAPRPPRGRPPCAPSPAFRDGETRSR